MTTVDRFPQRWVLPLAIIALILPIVFIEYQVMSYTKGVLAYPLDDTFIHMGIARNLVLHGVWGISSNEFVSASSSILYPPLLAVTYLLTGPNMILPLIINLLTGIVILVVMQRWLRRQGLRPLSQLLVIVTAIFFTPLPVIISTGMEHTLQILFCFLFIFRFSEWLSVGAVSGKTSWNVSREVLLYGVLVTATRYEGMFLICIACSLLLYYRQWWLSFQLALISMLPIILFGIYSVYKGNYFLPNSVLLKADNVPLSPASIVEFLTQGIFQKLFYTVSTTSAVAVERLMILLPLTYLIFLEQLRKELTYRCILIFLIAATFLHMAFANTSWFFRYEAYLLAPSMIIIGLLIAKYGREVISGKSLVTGWVGAFISLSLIFPLFLRSMDATTGFEKACHNIYDQNYNMALFLHKYYDTTTIAINDLGCPSYFLSGKLVDLWGLGSIEVAESKRHKNYTTPFLDSLIKKENAKIAVVFDRLYGPDLLAKWRKIAIWHIEDRYMAGGDDLCFYAIDSTMGPALVKNLLSYHQFLPPGVTAYYAKVK